LANGSKKDLTNPVHGPPELGCVPLMTKVEISFDNLVMSLL